MPGSGFPEAFNLVLSSRQHIGLLPGSPLDTGDADVSKRSGTTRLEMACGAGLCGQRRQGTAGTRGLTPGGRGTCRDSQRSFVLLDYEKVTQVCVCVYKCADTKTEESPTAATLAFGFP